MGQDDGSLSLCACTDTRGFTKIEGSLQFINLKVETNHDSYSSVGLMPV